MAACGATVLVSRRPYKFHRGAQETGKVALKCGDHEKAKSASWDVRGNQQTTLDQGART